MKELSKKYGLSSSGDPGVNFTNILRAAFTSVDPKRAKWLMGSGCIKAERKTLVKSRPKKIFV